MGDEETGPSQPCSPQPFTSHRTTTTNRDCHERKDGERERTTSRSPVSPRGCDCCSSHSQPSASTSTASTSFSSMAPLMPFSTPIHSNVNLKFAKRKTQRDVKRYCSLCRQHGLLEETRGHSCSKRDCECVKCKLMRRRREIMTSQIRLRREQERVMERRFDGEMVPLLPSHRLHPSTSPTQQSSPITASCSIIEEATTAVYACQKCKNHGIVQSKKDHIKDCQFATCECPLCSLIDSRRKVEICMKECQASESPQSDGKSPETSRSSWSQNEALCCSNPFLEMLTNSTKSTASPTNLCAQLPPLLVPTTIQSFGTGSSSAHFPITTVYLPVRDHPLLPTTISSLISTSQQQLLHQFAHPLLPMNRFLQKENNQSPFFPLPALPPSDFIPPTVTTVPLIFPTFSQNLFTAEYQNLLGEALLGLSPNPTLPVTTSGATGL